MEAWVVIVIVLGAFALLALGGALAQRRRLASTRAHFAENLDRVNNDLAAAHAADKGWDPERLHAAARHAAEEHAGGASAEPVLVAVVDPPGIEDDKAIFDVDGRRLTLGRVGDDWRFESLS